MATEIQVVPQQPTETRQLAHRQTLEPMTLADAKEFAAIVANSELAPKDYRGKPANVLVAIQFGKELGVPPMQALQGIAVINGRPAVWGDLALALVRAHPECESVEEDDFDTIRKAGMKATCTVHRRGEKPIKRTFSEFDAKAAGLWNKQGPWQQYPLRMLQMRARGFAIRDAFPDALKGLVTAEEAQDYRVIDAQVQPEQPTPAAAGPEPAITQDQAREFSRAARQRLGTTQEAKDAIRKYMLDELHVSSSLRIPASRFEEAMKWATGNVAPDPAETPQTETAADVDGAAKQRCFELFEILGYTPSQQAIAITDAKADYAAIATKLEAELPEEQ